jgi:hypothetical protein
LIVTTSQTAIISSTVVPLDPQFLLDLARQAVAVVIVELHVERLEAPQHRRADPAGGDGADMHPLDVERAGDAVGDVPAAGAGDFVRGDEVPDQSQDRHHDMLGDADRVAIGHFGDGDAPLDRRLEVDMVGADAGGDRQLQSIRLGDPLAGQIGRPERLGDDHVGVGQLALEAGIRAVLVRGDHQLMSLDLQPGAQAERAGDAAEQLSRAEVDRSGRGQRLTVRITLENRQVVPRAAVGIAGLGVVVEDAQDLRHNRAPWGQSPFRRVTDFLRRRAEK